MVKHGWMPEAAIAALGLDGALASWLLERGSITARLRRDDPSIAVRVLDEGHQPPLPDEAARLGLLTGEHAWVRCITLSGASGDRVYARSVIPDWSASNPWHDVQRLGTQPLGELLFSDKSLWRSPFEIGRLPAGPHAALWGNDQAQAPWARRCEFRRAGAPLLLTEAFLT
jgi:chorismate--pyruvate lyase